MKQDYDKPAKTKVKRSIAGLGLIAQEPIKKGTFIIEYKGPMLTEAEVQAKGGKYLFEISRNRTIDGSSRKNKARYINHFCKPNAEVDIKKGRVFISAIKNIEAGQEIGYDYGKEYYDEFIKSHGCKCPAEKHLYLPRKKKPAKKKTA
jgi:uncharacterized protein